MPALIRTYRPEDLQPCREIWVELTEWHRRIYHSPGIGGTDPGRQFDEHLDRLGADYIWVAEMDARVVGMAGLIPGEIEAELKPLIVSERYRGFGIGRELAETVIAAAQAGGFRKVKVRPGDRQVWKQGEQLAGRSFRV